LGRMLTCTLFEAMQVSLIESGGFRR
jgi:hypothetical protein